jgi:LPS export ABC transporter protein LptC
MNKKTLLQVLLVFLIILISLGFYFKYFNKSSKISDQNKNTGIVDSDQNNSSTYIRNIDYNSYDAKGNRYQITAELSEIKVENSDMMFLTNVIAYVFIKDSDTVKITSNFGKYNSKNYDSIFSENVIVIYPGHKITGEYLDFSFLDNLGIMSINVVYNGDKTNLFADKIEMDLKTKDMKIFMDDVNKKVLVKKAK